MIELGGDAAGILCHAADSVATADGETHRFAALFSRDACERRLQHEAPI
jgi:hypothetical protein